MTPLYRLVILISLLTAVIPNAASAGSLQTIDGRALETLMADGKPLVLVDVREPDEYAAGHLPGAINIPYGEAKGRIFKVLSPSDRIVFICHGGPMGDELGGLLAAKNYPEVYNLAGGMKKWRGALVR